MEIGKPILVQDMQAPKTRWKREDQLTDRSYIVDVESQQIRRNRRFLKQSVNPPGERELGDEEAIVSGEEVGSQVEQTPDTTTQQDAVEANAGVEFEPKYWSRAVWRSRNIHQWCKYEGKRPNQPVKAVPCIQRKAEEFLGSQLDIKIMSSSEQTVCAPK